MSVVNPVSQGVQLYIRVTQSSISCASQFHLFISSKTLRHYLFIYLRNRIEFKFFFFFFKLKK